MRVLLIDDSAALRSRLAALLREVDGIVVVGEADDGELALERTRELSPDVVLLDLQMSRRGGLDVLPELKRTPSAPTVVVLTNHATDAYRARCAELGADYFFDKATEIDRMMAVLSERAGRT